MSSRHCALALVSLLLYSSLAYAQTKYADLYPLPPIAEGSTLEEPDPQPPSEAREKISSWTSPTGRVGAFSDFLSEGHLYYGGELIVFNTSWGPSPEDDTLAASRHKLGWEHESGLGLRARYLTLDADWNVTNGPSGAHITNPEPGDFANYFPYYYGSLLLGREVDNLNLDLYKRFMFGKTEVLLGSGLSTVRNIERFQRVFDTGVPQQDYSYDFADESMKGTGVGLVGELKSPLITRDTSEVSFLLGGRTSYVPVELESQSELINLSRDDNLWIHEANIGVELRKRLEGLTLILRGQYELQEWDADFAENRGFNGVSFSVGLGW